MKRRLTPSAYFQAIHGEITPEAISAAFVRMMPEDAIIVTRASPPGVHSFRTAGRTPHSRGLQSPGGAIGDGLPMAVGAANRVLRTARLSSCKSDGSAMYTNQAFGPWRVKNWISHLAVLEPVLIGFLKVR